MLRASTRFLLGLILLAISPVAALALPAITCHCFKDRSYDPARPTLADPYFLATTQNSFFAHVFAVEKKTIVMKKQAGTSSDDLWIAYWVAARSGITAEALLEAKQSKETWREVIAPHGLTAKKLGNRFVAALQAKGGSSRLAETVVDELLLRYQLFNDAELAALRKTGATNQELIIAILAGSKTRQPAMQVYLEVKSGKTSWGALLQRAGIDGPGIPGEISALLKLHQR